MILFVILAISDDKRLYMKHFNLYYYSNSVHDSGGFYVMWSLKPLRVGKHCQMETKHSAWDEIHGKPLA